MARYDPQDDWGDEREWRNPLKPFLIALTVLLVLFAVIIGLLYLRLRSSTEKADKLTAELAAVQTELDAARTELSSTPEPTEAPTPSPEPTATPEPTPEPTATPEPTPEPTPTPPPLLRDSITDEELAGAFRPADESWFDSAREGTCSAAYMLALRWGPGMEWNEMGVIMAGDPVEALARQRGWMLIRTKDKLLAWCAADCIRLTEDVPAATEAPAAVVPAPADPGYVPPAATAAPVVTPAPTVNTEVSNPDLSR